MIEQIKSKYENLEELEPIVFKETYRAVFDPKDKESVEKFIDHIVSQQKEKYTKSYGPNLIFWISSGEYQISLAIFCDMISLMIVRNE